MRTHIAKSLQTRSKAIQRAVESYNKAAARLSPPREKLDWSKLSQCGYVEELTILRSARSDIRDKPWVKPVYREMLKLRHRIARASEEVIRCNVETRRLYTSIYDETGLFAQVIARLRSSNDRLLGPTRDLVIRRHGVNRVLLKYIEKIYALPGFTGDVTRGLRQGTVRAEPHPTTEELDAVPPAPDIDENEEDNVIEEDEELQEKLQVLETYMSNLTL